MAIRTAGGMITYGNLRTTIVLVKETSADLAPSEVAVTDIRKTDEHTTSLALPGTMNERA